MRTWLIPLGCMAIFSVAQAQAQEQGAPPPAQGAPTLREACRTDVQKLCAGVQPGGGRIRECISAHRDELSPGCRDAVRAARAQRPGAKGEGAQEPPTKPQ